jgi:hypothetical protein
VVTMMRRRLMLRSLNRRCQMVMMLRVKGHLLQSRSLLTRLVPTCRCKPSLPLLIGLLSGAPSASGHKRKRPLTIPKCKPPKTLPDQVMNQIVLPPYREPRSPLDLVAIEIIFGRLFEAFQRTSQAAGTSSSVSGDTQPLKKKKRRY